MEKNSFMLFASLMLLVSALWIYAQDQDEYQPYTPFEISQEQLSQIVGYSFLQGSLLEVLVGDFAHYPDEGVSICDRFRSRFDYHVLFEMTNLPEDARMEMFARIEALRLNHFKRLNFDCKAIWEGW